MDFNSGTRLNEQCNWQQGYMDLKRDKEVLQTQLKGQNIFIRNYLATFNLSVFQCILCDRPLSELDHFLVNSLCGHCYHVNCFRQPGLNGRSDTTCFKSCLTVFNPHDLIEIEIQSPRGDNQSTMSNFMFQQQLDIFTRDQIIISMGEHLEKLKKQIQRQRARAAAEETLKASTYNPWTSQTVSELIASESSRKQMSRPRVSFDGLNPSSAPFVTSTSNSLSQIMPTSSQINVDDSERDVLIVNETPPRIPRMVIQEISR
jgi:hypothetical protein